VEIKKKEQLSYTIKFLVETSLTMNK